MFKFAAYDNQSKECNDGNNFIKYRAVNLELPCPIYQNPQPFMYTVLSNEMSKSTPDTLLEVF
jgi:hypothetical protein